MFFTTIKETKTKKPTIFSGLHLAWESGKVSGRTRALQEGQKLAGETSGRGGLSQGGTQSHSWAHFWETKIEPLLLKEQK